MPPVIPNPDAILAFETAAAFETWLAAHHDSWSEVWLKIHKKGSGLPTVTYAEALDSALCWGWIDGLKKSFDEVSFIQRFTPRTARSIWSQVNTGHVQRLIDAGRMRPEGLRHVEAARADGRWDRAYAAGRNMTVPDDLLAAVTAKPKAFKTFRTLNRQNLFAMAFRLGNIKTPERRAKRIAEYVAMLERGETLYPNGGGSAG